jgi:hypothetical protein
MVLVTPFSSLFPSCQDLVAHHVGRSDGYNSIGVPTLSWFDALSSPFLSYFIIMLSSFAQYPSDGSPSLPGHALAVHPPN